MLKPGHQTDRETSFPGVRGEITRPRMQRTGSQPQFKASLMPDGALEMLIYGDIVDAATISMLEDWGCSTDGFVSSLSVKRAMDSAGAFSRIRLRINSPGGDAFEGMAIHSLISACGKPVDVFVDGIAASSASIIAMVGGTRVMGRVSMMMIHNAWTCVCGNKADLAKMAGTLDKIDESIAAAYTIRTGQTSEQIMALMSAETWLTAQDCVEQGFATGIIQQPAEDETSAMAMARGFRALARLKRVPQALHAKAKKENEDLDDNANGCECSCDACRDNDCANCSNESCVDENCEDCPMQREAENAIPLAPNNLSRFQAIQHGIDKRLKATPAPAA